MKNFIFKIAVLSLLIYSCTEKGIRYTGIHVPLKKEIKGNPINTTFIFSHPKEITIIDSLLIIRDSYKQDCSFHIFNKTSGKHLKSFGNQGRGPGEVLYPSSLHYNPNNRTLATIEINLKKIVEYNIANILSETQPFFSETKLNFTAKEIIPYKDLFIISGFYERFTIKDTNGQILHQYTDYPKLVPIEDENLVIFNYLTQHAVQSGGDKLVSITCIGGVLEIFNLKNNKITSKITKYINEPIYKVLPDGKPKWITPTQETVFGCSNIYATEKYIYCIYEGELSKDPKIAPKKILVFDWEGNLILQYIIKEGIPNTIAVDENYLYSIITTSSGEYELYKYSYKN